MKKNVFFLGLLSLLLFSFTSCKQTTKELISETKWSAKSETRSYTVSFTDNLFEWESLSKTDTIRLNGSYSILKGSIVKGKDGSEKSNPDTLRLIPINDTMTYKVAYLKDKGVLTCKIDECTKIEFKENKAFGWFEFITLIGSLGLFLYGMKLMSESLQKAAGDKLRNVLSAMTSTRLTGILTGVGVTALIQSSSATTVMVVSFVNAGLLDLSQAFGVIMGANVGTTVTAWIISLFGFKVDISALAIPIIAVSFPLIFSSNSRRKSWGEFILGFAILFMGLGFLKAAVPDIKANPQVLEFLSSYSNLGFGSVLIFLAVGSILTVVVQSSSATMAITLIMLTSGWFGSLDDPHTALNAFRLAAAMVLGENIGTTITANIAALSGNNSAKRAAFSHLMFNVFGVLWMLIFFNPFTAMIDSFPITNTQTDSAFSLALFHTLFNILNVFILVWFSKWIVQFVKWVIRPAKTDEEEEFHLTYISSGILSTSELSILQAKKEIVSFSERTERMFGMVDELFKESKNSESVALYSRIQKYENICDRMDLEIAGYLTKVSNGRLSDSGKHQVQMKIRIVGEIESIADACYNIARTIMRRNEQKIKFTKEINNNINVMFSKVEKALEHMTTVLKTNNLEVADVNKAKNIEAEINNLRTQLKNQNLIDVNEGKYAYTHSVVYMDLIVECEKIGDYVVNVVEAVADHKLYDVKVSK